MANLIMDEVKKNGRVKIGETEYAVPTKVFRVIKECDDFVRAGAVGPDFFPDLITGQMIIHPINSGEILNLMWNELTTMKEGPNYDEAFAFYLGFTLHYACDMFSHYYINEYAGGFFPAIEETISYDFPNTFRIDSQKLSIILKHVTIESYLDKKVEKQNFSIKAPLKYLMRCFGTIEAWEKIGKNVPETDYDFLRIMINEYSQALKSGKNVDSRYSQELQKRVEIWMEEWEKFAQASVSGNSYDFSKILDIIRKTPTDKNIIKFAHLLIFLYQIESSPLATVITIIDYIINPLAWIDDTVKLVFCKSVLKALYEINDEKKETPNTINDCKEEIRHQIFKYVTEPELILNDSLLFESLRRQKNCTRLTDYFDKEWGNFGEYTDCQSQTFDVFRHCLNMGKLCLVGNNNLIKISEKYKPKLGSFGFKDGSNIFKDGVLTHKVSKIKVKIKVADEYRAGTDYDTHLKVIHKNGYTKYYIDSKGNDLERGHEYTYQIIFDYSIALNDFKEFELGCDYTLYSAMFIIDKIEITDIDSDVVLASAGHSVIQRGKPLTIRVN